MRKLAIATLVGLLALSAPALAQARGRHARHHHNHGHVRLVHLGAAFKSSTTTPASEGGENAGSVLSFEEGVLTLTLKNGKVSGLVTEQTEIRCAPATAMAHESDNGGNGDGFGNDGEQGQEHQNGDDNGQGDDDQEDQEEHGGPSQCGTSSLVPGALVRAAELRIGPSGAVFEEIELVG